MEIIAERGLGKLKGKVQSDLESVLQERAMMGLSFPDDFEVRINYGFNQGGLAYANRTDDVYLIGLNVIPSVFERDNSLILYEEGLMIKRFFVRAQTLLSDDCDESMIIELMNHPRKTLSGLEDSFTREEFEQFKEMIEYKGVKYEDLKQIVIQTAKKVRDIYKDVEPKAVEKFAELDLIDTHLRHEMDHLDFFGSRLYDIFYEIGTSLIESNDKVNSGEMNYTTQLKKDIKRFLNITSKFKVLLEARALFFTYVGQEGWKGADYKRIKREVYRHLHSYVETEYTSVILDRLLVGRPDQPTLDTVNYLKKLVLLQSLDPSSVQYNGMGDNVNYSLVNMVLYEELPIWKKRFMDNAMIATEAIGNAFRDDPTRFADAQGARTFNEYIRIIGG